MIERREAWMARAVALSKKGFPAPNPRVGCVIVKNGKIVGEGFHKSAGGPHAEAVALAAAGAAAKGADVFVTLEPCAHHGRTPPCADALVDAGVSSVCFAVADPNPIAKGGGDRLKAAGIRVEAGLGAQDAEKASWQYLTAVRRRRPVVCAKAAVTIDGFMAREDGTSQWITGPQARREGHRLRAELGAVLVGCRTVLTDDPRLTARLPGVVNQPLRIVLDPHVRLSGSEAVFQQPGKTLWVVTKGRETDDCQLGLEAKAGFDLEELLEHLYSAGCRGVLVEGGPRTIRRFFDSRTVDLLELFTGPKMFGSGTRFEGPGRPLDLSGPIRVQRLGPDVRTTYALAEILKIV